MKLKTLLTIIAISTIGFIGGGLSDFNNLNAIDGNLEPYADGESAEHPITNPNNDITNLIAPYYKFEGTWANTEGRITISGNVQIELDSTARVTINGGIHCGEGCTLTITGDNAGELTVTNVGGNNAGIGGNNDETAGTINIQGGTISATAGDKGAGIGGGNYRAGGTINIEGGKITSTGAQHSAGIGGGGGGAGGTITISGGEIIANGGNQAAGIGGGRNLAGGEITISGGDISATGGPYGAGIGGGIAGPGGTIKIEGGTIESAQGGVNGAGIGGGSGISGTGGTINIEGGTIESAQGGVNSAGIGGGNGAGGGTINIEGGTIESAQGGDGGAGIGVGADGSGGTTQITGGSINTASIDPTPTDGISPVYLNKLTVEGFDNSPVIAYYESEYRINGTVVDEEGNLYFYLPATSGAELLALSFEPDEGNKPYYGLKYQREDNDENEETLKYLQLDTPSAAIDLTNKKLTGLLPDTDYDISIHNGGLGGLSLDLDTHSLTQHNGVVTQHNGVVTQQNGVVTQQNGSIIQANGEGEILFDVSWEGYSIDIVQSYTIPYSDSEAQVLDIPGMPAVPGDSAAPLDLAGTGLDLDLAYILMVLLLAFGTVLRKRVISA